MNLFTRFFMGLYTALYRFTKGRFGGKMGPNKVLLLNTTGRKSGKSRTTPLGCFEWQGGYLIVASNGGQSSNPGWYYNLRSNPQASIQVFDQVIPIKAEVLAGEARAQAWQEVIRVAPAYDRYTQKTKREIPLILLRAA